MALITSRYTMDKQDPGIRRYLADRADLLGAIRLPNTAFKANAGTEVTTDILFLQKRAPGSPASGEAWQDLAAIETPDGAILINEYFARHPGMMLGQMRLERGLYNAREPTLAGDLSPERLLDALSALPARIYSNSHGQRTSQAVISTEIPVLDGVKDGGFAERDGVIVVRNGDHFETVSLGASTAARVRGMMAVRDAVRLVFKTQLDLSLIHI